jgi:hypothetical protein
MPRKKRTNSEPQAASERSSRKRQWVTGALVLVLVGVPLAIFVPGWMKSREAPRVTLREALAARLACSPESLHMNVPPASGRYPGALLVRAPDGLLLPVTFEHRPDGVGAPSFELEGYAVTSASAALSGTVGGGQKFDSDVDELLDVSLQLREGRVIEAPLPSLRERVASDGDVARLRARGRDPEVIVRAYEATCDLVLRQRSEMNAKQWLELRKAALKSSAELREDGSLVFRSKSPSVVAYETLSVGIVADSLGSGEPRVVLTETVAENISGPAKPRASPTTTVFAGVASTRNPLLGDLPAAQNSLTLMEEAMAEAGVEERVTWASDGLLDKDTLFGWLRGVAERTEKAAAEAVVVYWVGHSVSLSNGQLYLVMGDYQGDLQEDVGSVERRDMLSEEGQPLSGTNIDDLVGVLQAVEDLAPDEVPGLVPLVEVHSFLAESEVPFVILVDGCYPAERMDELREELYLTEWGDYFGPNLSPDMGRYSKALGIFGKRPYLTSPDPVVLAAKPGTLAPIRRHPWNEWDFATGVGPLASRVAWNIRRSRGYSEGLSWGQLLSLIADQKRGLGELSVRGSITWSDFSVFDALQLL